MKKLLILLLFLPIFSNAQYIDLTNGKWYFTNGQEYWTTPPNIIYVPKYGDFEEFSSVKDTIIDSKTAHIFPNISPYFNLKYIYHSHQDSLFFFNDNTKEFELCFYFGVAKGDSLIVYDAHLNSHTMIYIDSITTEVIESLPLKVFHFHTEFSNKGRVIEKIFNFNSGGHFFPTFIQPFFQAPRLKCYEDSDIHVNLATIPCDSIVPSTYISIEKLEASQALSIYPNPNNGQLFIEGLEQNPLPFSVIDLQGRNVFSGIYQGKGIELPSFMVSGIYILQLENRDGIHRKKFVLQR